MSNDSRVIIGVMASGRGSNFAALLQRQTENYFRKARIECLISNRLAAPALDLACEAGLAAYAIQPRDFQTAEAYEQEIVRLFDQHNINFLLLAGYMKIVGPTILNRYEGRIINIHPSLLPAFPGLCAQRQALEHGVRVSGCTVHFVDDGLDSGPIIAQRAVPVMPEDTEEELSLRILVEEHELFSRCVKAITEYPWNLDGRRVIFEDKHPESS